MAFWLARKRRGQDSDWIQRFDPRFWTVDFPRPMMASVVTTAPDALRVECEFHHANALAGLIWWSEDTLDHPLLAYDTDRDYSRTTLSFRWRSSGLIALDQPHGPTLTIEGHDAAGNPRSWYVRLWNYAVGTPEDAAITLPFSALAADWLADGEAVYPSAIDRMFISLAPPGYNASSNALLPARVNGWAELSDIRCRGHRAMVAIGDVVLPPHDVGLCTAYDDAYNQTPERLLRGAEGLGYRTGIVHYVGMSHYYRLESGAEGLKAVSSGVLALPCEAWHSDYFRRTVELGQPLTISLSYELLDQDCPDAYKQRFADGTQALTGWVPPSTLLSPRNSSALSFLRNIASAFVTLQRDAGAAQLAFQIGEPWWWTTADGRIALYDDAAVASYGETPPVIADLREPLDATQTDYLDAAGYWLFISTSSIANRVRGVAGTLPSEISVLVFTPTVLAAEMPELHRANLPALWRWPRFDRLQLEDYDWLTSGANADRRRAYDFVQDKLTYPLDQQDYLAGFVLSAEDADRFWRMIDDGLQQAATRGVSRHFVWAQPQINRDGYTRLAPPMEDDDMQAFDDVLYPLPLGRDAAIAPEFSTSVATTSSGHERRSSLWSDARLRFDVGPGLRSEAELQALLAFFRARRGAARGFRLADPFDHSSNGAAGVPTPTDQLLGFGDGLNGDFALVKRYGEEPDPQIRRITRPRVGTVAVSIDGVEQASGWTLESGATVRFDIAPPEGGEIRAGFLFDVPVRFAEDRLDINGATFAAGEAPSVPLIEIRE